MSEWTQDRIDLASKLWLSGVSGKQIAEQLGGLTRNAVMGKIDRLGLLRLPRGNGAPIVVAAKRKPRPVADATDRAVAEQPAIVQVADVPATQAELPVPPVAVKLAKDPQPAPKAPSAVVAIPVSSRVAAVVGEPVQIMDLRDYMCKWPLGDPSSASFRYCGQRKQGGAPYCESHVQLAYMPSTPRLRGAARAAATSRR